MIGILCGVALAVLPVPKAQDGPKPLHELAVPGRDRGGLPTPWVAFTPDGRTVATVVPVECTGNHIIAVDIATGKQIASARTSSGRFRQGVLISPDGRAVWDLLKRSVDQPSFALPLRPGPLGIDWPTPAPIFPKRSPEESICRHWSDGQVLFRACFDSAYRLECWKPDERKHDTILRGAVNDKQHSTGTFALDPVNLRFAVGVNDSKSDKWTLHCWALSAKPKPVNTEIELPAPSFALECSPDGKYLASGMTDGSLGVWDAATGKAVFEPRVLGQFTVAALAFHPSGKFIACGTFDDRGAANVYLVEVESGDILQKFRAHPSDVMAVGFDRTGDRLAVVVRNAVKIYDARPLLGLQTE